MHNELNLRELCDFPQSQPLVRICHFDCSMNRIRVIQISMSNFNIRPYNAPDFQKSRIPVGPGIVVLNYCVLTSAYPCDTVNSRGFDSMPKLDVFSYYLR